MKLRSATVRGQRSLGDQMAQAAAAVATDSEKITFALIPSTLSGVHCTSQTCGAEPVPVANFSRASLRGPGPEKVKTSSNIAGHQHPVNGDVVVGEELTQHGGNRHVRVFQRGFGGHTVSSKARRTIWRNQDDPFGFRQLDHTVGFVLTFQQDIAKKSITAD